MMKPIWELFIAISIVIICILVYGNSQVFEHCTVIVDPFIKTGKC